VKVNIRIAYYIISLTWLPKRRNRTAPYMAELLILIMLRFAGRISQVLYADFSEETAWLKPLSLRGFE
jgi:hypothetical protein